MTHRSSTSRRRTLANARTPKLIPGATSARPDAMALANLRSYFMKLMPKGTRIYGILRSKGKSGTRVIQFVFATKDRTIEPVPANAGILAGIPWSEPKQGFVFRGSGYNALQMMAEALGQDLHNNSSAIVYDGWL